MNWKFWENRAVNYTQGRDNLTFARITGASLQVVTTAAAEAASGMIARAFASAEVKGPEPYIQGLTPDTMMLIGRTLMRDGQIGFAIDVQGGGVMLQPASEIEAFGTYDPASWFYRLNLPGPTDYVTRYPIPGAGVLHFRYLTNPSNPWRGISPIMSAALAGKLSAEVTSALADELSQPRGTLLPLPNSGGNDPKIDKLKEDLKALAGDLATVESMKGGWGNRADGKSDQHDWAGQRIGAEPPASIVSLQTAAFNQLISATGLSPLLFNPASPGGSYREAFRQGLHGVIAPLGRIVERELKNKLHPSISINFDPLAAADIGGKARAVMQFVGAGVALDRALTLAGLMQDES